jgi:hypothetical protein
MLGLKQGFLPMSRCAALAIPGLCLQDLGKDEAGIFTSPLRLRAKDAPWLAPPGVATGLAFTYDPGAAKAAGVDASRAATADQIARFGSFVATCAEAEGFTFSDWPKEIPNLLRRADRPWKLLSTPGR